MSFGESREFINNNRLFYSEKNLQSGFIVDQNRINVDYGPHVETKTSLANTGDHADAAGDGVPGGPVGGCRVVVYPGNGVGGHGADPSGTP